MDEFIEIAKFVVGFMLVITLLFGILVVAFSPLMLYECHTVADKMNTDYQFNIVGGCFLQTADGSYIARDLYRGVEIIEEEPND
jgi:hypothetical protein